MKRLMMPALIAVAAAAGWFGLGYHMEIAAGLENDLAPVTALGGSRGAQDVLWVQNGSAGTVLRVGRYACQRYTRTADGCQQVGS